MWVKSKLDRNAPNFSDIMKLLHEMRLESKEQTENLKTELDKSIEHCLQTIADRRKTAYFQSNSLDEYKELESSV